MISKKIAVITFHASHNSGSMLQSYALQTILSNKYETYSEILDFKNDGSREKYSFYLKNNSIKNIIKNILFTYYFKFKNNEYYKYQEFIEEYLNVSKEKYYTLSDFYNVEEKYDIFISGSDQIWNITCQDADDAYFLPFVKNKKKVAYSISFGAKNIAKNTDDVEKYKRYINSYDYLSVREFNAMKWLSDLTNKKIDVICDPTLLLCKDDYLEIIDDSGVNGEFIFYYSFGYDDYENEIVQKIAERTNLQVVIFNGKRWATLHNRYKSFVIPNVESPMTFLDLINKSKMVITSSFHGTVFSSIFHKKFFVIKNDGMKNGDDRVLSILKQLELTDRFIEDEFIDLDKKIDYCKVDDNIKKLQQQAFEFLDEVLNYEEK